MELAVHGSQAIRLVGLMSFQYLDWYDQSILKQVVEDHAVEDVD